MFDQNEKKSCTDQNQKLNEKVVRSCGTTEGNCAEAEGFATKATGFASHAEGQSTTASEGNAHAEGSFTLANKNAAHAEGDSTDAIGIAAHAEGKNTTASDVAHAEGKETKAIKEAAHAEGNNTTASGEASHAEGVRTTAFGSAAHAEGENTTAAFKNTHTEGEGTRADAIRAHAEGGFTKALREAAHAEGTGTTAFGIAAHSEGSSTTAKGDYSHAEGLYSSATGGASHAEGDGNNASGFASHAEGAYNKASAISSHAEGFDTKADANYSHAEGRFTSTNNKEGAHIMGRFGNATDTHSWHLANGTDSSNLSLAAKILSDGRGIADRGWFTGNADYAEMFETVDGQPFNVGYFVTLEGKKIRKAKTTDDYILGIVTADPAVLADSGELRWKDKYVTDEWGRIQYHDVVIPAEKDTGGNVSIPKRTEKQPILNPDWDHTKEYIPRSQRPEWVAVALLGKLRVRDDGTCQVNGYCKHNDEGIATASENGYRVMERIGPNQIMVLFR
ncbi:peptidase G2 autoproteolytic cleavage domain-containing protein [Metabacillus sp. Hm71]|uniref:peptidase G2 autoproteolytic cleavage domain-containing protein n=1 Tax=Metabacillus sp. Hm71 TaxID=3450743 RepID=UPI003F41C44E